MSGAVTEHELLQTMIVGRSYRRSDVASLLDEKPTAAVLDALEALVRKGIVWRTYVGSRFEYIRLTIVQLADMANRKADQIDTPKRAGKPLTGYGDWLERHRALAMSTRGTA
ncbi:hypothetical protein WI36_24010 [Burkholderia ubonensis]|uniref:hypothetical protein n=1 Tax=Burkholderia ubonensis TaxID=101571 RepID=UPI00075BFC50|nr:hypothetical protein [Burkholderia ubonensis]KUZ66836.1 hypothetical protein WI36_24010 [Burkholderia ubonensis]